MFKNLNPNMIGLRGRSIDDAMAMAQEGGFAGIDFDIREAAALADVHGVEHVRGKFASAGLKPGVWSLPFNYRQDEEQYRAGLAELPRFAELGRALGATRVGGGVGPSSAEREYAANFAWHVERLGPLAEVLKQHDCRLSLEFIGPKTLRARNPHEFIYTLPGLIELWQTVGTGNIGVTLDVWHLYTSGGTLEDMDRLTNRDVVNVHVNDAPAGIPRDEQIDNQRLLPMESGVLDLVGFMGKLKAIGYDGPVTVEPFSQRLNDIAAADPPAAVAETARALDAMWRAAALS
jgi:sugar phosphate isomerase/epimerase